MTNHADSDGELLLARLKEGRDDAAALALLELFQSGFPIVRLRELLTGPSKTATRTGTWIASELGADARPLLPEVDRLLAHEDRYVRFFALDIVLVNADQGDGAILGAAAELLRDEDKAVRWKAMNFLASASEPQLLECAHHASDTTLQELLRWLVHSDMLGASAVRTKLESNDRLERVIAVIAAARISVTDPSVLQESIEASDVEVREFATDRLAQQAGRNY